MIWHAGSDYIGRTVQPSCLQHSSLGPSSRESCFTGYHFFSPVKEETQSRLKYHSWNKSWASRFLLSCSYAVYQHLTSQLITGKWTTHRMNITACVTFYMRRGPRNWSPEKWNDFFRAKYSTYFSLQEKRMAGTASAWPVHPQLR